MSTPMEGVLTQDTKPFIHKTRRQLAIETPEDAPKLQVRWHYAIDVPKRRVYPEKAPPSKPKKEPSQWLPFSKRDNLKIENTWNASKDEENTPRVPVNEDHLFELNLDERELGPIYWRGPVYDVVRGTWFFADGSTLKPCEENLATQVEDGYLKVAPWRDVPSQPAEPNTESIPTSNTNTATPTKPEKKAVFDSAKKDPHKDHMRPLFGAYTGKYVLYTSKSTAWLLSDDLYGKISTSFFQSVTRGLHMGGQKLKRGYEREPAAPKVEEVARDVEETVDETTAIPLPEPVTSAAKEADAGTGTAPANESDKSQDVEDPDRKIEHLVLCCHGIGQKLGERLEAVNFVHDVNVLRRTLKKTFQQSRDLQTLGENRLNCGMQVLPVEWRQNIQFGMSRDYDEPESSKNEKDLTNVPDEEEEHATLQDITIEGVQTIRNLVSDVLLDVLLYYQPSYREKIVRTVSREMNRVYALFKQNNPSFDGKVSILGHSLGSAIAFDILCRQPTDPEEAVPKENYLDPNLALDFDCENFYAVGSPIGLFQMLRGKNIAARSQLKTAELPFSPLGGKHNPFEGPPMSYPKTKNMYNLFHPSDPVSYRVEPLISKHTAKLKPYPVPYTKAGIRQQLVGLSSIPQRAYEGASSYWGALTSTITNSIVSRSLGYSDLTATPTKVELEDEKQRLASQITKEHEDTLFAGFEKAWGSNHSKKLEGEQKLKALNKSGRVDFSLQEDMFGSSYVSAISAHLQYWGEPDLAHFMLSYSLVHEAAPEPRAQLPRLDTNL